MNPKLAKNVLRGLGVVTALAGLLSIYAFIAACINVFLHIWVHPAASDILIELLITLAGIAFGAYVVYLSYLLAFRLSRSAFQRVFFLAIIFIAVAARRGPSSPLYLLFCAGVGLFGVILLHLISSRLFGGHE